jgi:hypothetical protein
MFRAPAGGRAMKPMQVLAWTAFIVTNLVLASQMQAIAIPALVVPAGAAAPPGWPASGCLSATVAPNDNQVVGQAGLCIANDKSIRATLDLAHLAPNARYVEWIAYFENPSRCSFGDVDSAMHNFNEPCTLADLDGPTPRGIVHAMALPTADAGGVIHLDGPVRAINLAPQAQAWLLLGQSSWSPVPHPWYRLAENSTRKLIARASFDLP